MRRLGKGATKKSTSVQSHSQGPSTRRADQRAGSLGIEVCDVCKICFYSKTSLSVHKRIHWRDCIFDCPNCNKRFNSLTNLRAHQKSHCFATVLTTKSPTEIKKSLTQTSTKSPSRTSTKTPSKLIKSPTKTTNVKTNKDASKINKTKSVSVTVRSTNNIMSPKKRVLQTEGEYRCKICSKICIGKLGLGSHERKHKETKKNQSKSWIYVDSKHIKTKMAGTTMACLLCKKTFFEERGLTKHIREDHRGQDMSQIDSIRPDGTITCDNCDMVFSSDKALTKHAKSCYDEDEEDDDEDDKDDKDQDYEDEDDEEEVADDGSGGDDVDFYQQLDKQINVPCPLCGKKFNNRHGLANHSRTHKKEQHENANQHKKAIAIKSKIHAKKNLVKDLKKVKSVKNEPIKVETKNQLTQIQKKTKPVKEEKLSSSRSIKCHVCEKDFMGGIALSNHVRKKHPGKPYPFKKRPKTPTKKKLPFECKNCFKGFTKSSSYNFHKKYKGLCQVEKCKKTTEECKESVVLVEKLNDKLVLMVAGNDGVSVSESENSTSLGEMDIGTEANTTEDMEVVPVVEEVIAPIEIQVVAISKVEGSGDLSTVQTKAGETLVNGKVEEGGEKKPNEEISMEIEESNKIVIEKEFAKDCGEIVESPVHMIKNASDLEIVTVDNSIDIVEVEIGDKESVHCADDIIPLEAPKKDEEISVPEIAPVINSNSPATTSENPPLLKDDGKVEDSVNKVDLVSNGGSPTKVAESDESNKVSRTTKNVPKLTEGKISQEKDSENPELKGIIDFINNDCSE